MRALLLALVASCTNYAEGPATDAGPDACSEIPQAIACAAQAAAWCGAIDHPADGCARVYARNCGHAGYVSVGEQATCLDAIKPGAHCEPAACVATWKGIVL